MLTRVSVGLVASALLAVSQDAMAQSRRSENVRRAPVSADDRRWDRDDDRRRDGDSVHAGSEGRGDQDEVDVASRHRAIDVPHKVTSLTVPGRTARS